MNKVNFKRWMSLLLAVLMIFSCMTNVVVYANADENGMGTEIEVTGPPTEVEETNSFEIDTVDEVIIDETEEPELIESEQYKDNSNNMVEFPFESTIEITIDEPKINTYNIMLLAQNSSRQSQIGDVAAKKRGILRSGTFNWSSIPTYGYSVAYDYILKDAFGYEHDAWCIDASLPSGEAHSATAVYVTELGGVGGAAINALANNAARALSVTMTLESLRYIDHEGKEKTNSPITSSGTISSGNVYMILRWFAWTNNRDNNGVGSYNGVSKNNASVQKDMINIAYDSGILPNLYLQHLEYTADALVYHGGTSNTSDSWIVSTSGYNGTERMAPFLYDDGSGYGPMAVQVSKKTTSELIDPLNPSAVLSKVPNILTSYNNMLKSLSDNIYDTCYSIISGYMGRTAHVWYSKTDVDNGTMSEQRFATVDNLPQRVDVAIQKTSSNNAVSSNNKMYNFEGIKYELWCNGKYYTTLTLGSNGISNKYIFDEATSLELLNKTIELREVDDNVRKTSGYSQNNNYATVIGNPSIENTDDYGTIIYNLATTSDMPITDPFNLKLYKYDSETGRSNDKIGM